MPRGRKKGASKANSEALSLTDVSLSTVRVPNLSKLTWWNELSPSEQAEVEDQSKNLAIARVMEGQSRLRMGLHLSTLKDILEPHGVYQKFIKRYFNFSLKTSYRYINGYNNAKARLPENVLKAAMARGMQIVGDTREKPLGIYTAPVKKLPPPVEATEEQANQYLDQLEAVRRQQRAKDSTHEEPLPQIDTETFLRHVVHFGAHRFNMLPHTNKVRSAAAHQCLAMLAMKFGIRNPLQLTPIAVPDSLEIKRGRPPLPRSQEAQAEA